MQDPWSNSCRDAPYCNLQFVSAPGNVSAPYEFYWRGTFSHQDCILELSLQRNAGLFYYELFTLAIIYSSKVRIKSFYSSMHNKFFSKHGEKVTTDRSVRISEINMFMSNGFHIFKFQKWRKKCIQFLITFFFSHARSVPNIVPFWMFQNFGPSLKVEVEIWWFHKSVPHKSWVNISVVK